MNKICKNCIYWLCNEKIKEDIIYQSSCIYSDIYDMGECKKVDFDVLNIQSNGFMVADDEGGQWAALYTGQDFGCIQFKNK